MCSHPAEKTSAFRPPHDSSQWKSSHTPPRPISLRSQAVALVNLGQEAPSHPLRSAVSDSAPASFLNRCIGDRTSRGASAVSWREACICDRARIERRVYVTEPGWFSKGRETPRSHAKQETWQRDQEHEAYVKMPRQRNRRRRAKKKNEGGF